MMIGHVYVIYCKGEICYVGSTMNMKRRWTEYNSNHRNPNREHYNMEIHKYMREEGFDKFQPEIVESYEVEKRIDLNHYEGMWQRTFNKLGFDLKNTLVAGNGGCVKGTQAYVNQLVSNREKVTCELCGARVNRNSLRRHQRRSKCKK